MKKIISFVLCLILGSSLLSGCSNDGEPFEEKMSRLTSELSELFAKSHELEAEIKERLGAIGYDI